MIAQRIMQDSLGEKEVKAIAKALTSPNPVIATSRLSRLRRELRKLNAPEKIISATYDEKTTCASNKIQKERRTPTVQVLADVMIMLCIHPAEIKDLRISNGSVTEYLKNRDQQDNPRVFRLLERDEKRAKLLLTWIQNAISSGQLRDPGVPVVKWFNTFLKKDRFLPETGKPLLPSYLRKLEAVFAVMLNGAKNLSDVTHAMTIASKALRHSPDNHASPAQNYTIVNFRLREQPYDQATAFKLFDEN
ncbi:hypothetical protein RhiirC2_801762 [Rhizophagus irregularis]|uniref:Uncharacterized protein n=1 Tax=Rhizophagus irregularis TaxID=588596 RepID=A0A2N1M251_9GLOM|nr:hypothetical protein RhiirC2_801762 [Rhizophagus irregularis]